MINMKVKEFIIDTWLTFMGLMYYQIFYRKSWYWSNEQNKKYQYKKLKKLLKVCANDVPYYQRLFKEIDFDVDRDFKSCEDIKKIPVTTKEVVRANQVDFINPKYKKRSLVLHTSGSTGEPLTFYASYRQWIAEQACGWRAMKHFGYKFRMKTAIVRSYAPKNGKLIKHEWLRNFRYYSPFDLSETNIKMFLDDMVTHGIRVLRGYPSSVRILADYVLEKNYAIPKLKFIITASEVLSNEDRKVIESAFRAPILNAYGMVEEAALMFTTDCNKNLHNCEDYSFVELLDTDQKNVKMIVGTNLNNYAMPIIRYQTNDLARINNEECICRKSGIMIENVIGRSNMVMKLTDRSIPLTNFYTVLEHFQSLKAWQIVQTSETDVELRFSGFFDEDADKRIKEEFARRLPKYVHFSIKYNSTFERINGGKKPPYISLSI